MRFTEGRQFAAYSAAVWGVVAALEVLLLVLDALPEEALPRGAVRPHLGKASCFVIEEDLNLLLYWFIFLCVSFVLNVCFVGGTAYYLKKGGASLIVCCSKGKKNDNSKSGNMGRHLDIFWQRFMFFVLTV